MTDRMNDREEVSCTVGLSDWAPNYLCRVLGTLLILADRILASADSLKDIVARSTESFPKSHSTVP